MTVPIWLWRVTVFAFWLSLAAIIVTAIALTFGAANPKPVGRLMQDIDLRARDECLELLPTAGPAWQCGEAGLNAALTQNASIVLAQFPQFSFSPSSFTFEITAAQTAGETSALYGIVFDFTDEANYSALVVNGNGYARAYRIEAGVERDWFALAQWPPVRVGSQTNRLRIDSDERRLTLRVNDEPLLERQDTARGALGLIARGFAPGQAIVFQRVRLWGE